MFPDIGSKFVVVYGIEAFLDPFLIIIVDCILLVRKLPFFGNIEKFKIIYCFGMFIKDYSFMVHIVSKSTAKQ